MKVVFFSKRIFPNHPLPILVYSLGYSVEDNIQNEILFWCIFFNDVHEYIYGQQPFR